MIYVQGFQLMLPIHAVFQATRRTPFAIVALGTDVIVATNTRVSS